MRFLRRSQTDDTEATQSSAEVASANEDAKEHAKGRTPGKGRPTPKRREAENRRRGPVPPPPRSQREAMRRMRGNKEERRKAAAERRERMMAGDDRYLLPRDRGPVRAYVRDLVDSRRNLVGLFMPMAVLVFVALLVPSVQVQQYASIVVMFMMLAMIFEGILLGRQVTKKVRQRFPDATDRGLSLGWYAFTRATQLRKLRVPRPRVTYGDQP
ncbi:Protein of unknown function (DUF3043) [Streptoalloteichus tenebrarius]|uniref:DUF3043 domain-containing protein n=1 Tax=Streptoalloteichus tenebrarius (strain ATCC 17920 / DSM 40477 / JCM 4838 / CBS 697.72 / NBRC 16177 / NCIMB 11028 / NRRL B-12390 / A12253. 1 / ISP 5477) TaxID=1933 RepID=A0ABT1HX36_STRSD|nr:DUF3043 domain-containing protein [Streptoalloteichus tenebrarius]MCP2260081.1 Protein of unknown function (DUF3043) [Streptoalloteichus tenebrarius]